MESTPIHETVAEIWARAVALFTESEDVKPTVRAWLNASRILGVRGSTLLVELPDAFSRDWLDARFRPHLERTLRAITARPWRLSLCSPGGQLPLQPPEEQPSPSQAAAHQAAAAGERAEALLPDASQRTRRGSRGARTLKAPGSGPAISASSPSPDAPQLARRAGPSGDAHPNPAAKPAAPPKPSDELPSGVLNPRYTFDTFVIGASNRFAYAACVAVGEQPAGQYNPLFIYGGVGLGKTHLMQAIGHHLLRTRPSVRVVYVTTETFTNELIDALQQRLMPDFRAKYRSADVLLIDDIQFVANKERTQEEFFHTFNALYEANRQIVICSDRPPKEIPTLEERLRSRFEWGLLADIQPPDFETRVAILRKKSETEQTPVPDEVLTYIAQQIPSNIRELEGALNRVVAWAQLHQEPLTAALAARVLAELFAQRQAPITLERIQDVVAEHFGVKVADLKSKRRTREHTFPRQVAMYLARQLTEASLPRIGEAFGGRDHSTVLHSCEKIARALAQDPGLELALKQMTERLSQP